MMSISSISSEEIMPNSLDATLPYIENSEETLIDQLLGSRESRPLHNAQEKQRESHENTALNENSSHIDAQDNQRVIEPRENEVAAFIIIEEESTESFREIDQANEKEPNPRTSISSPICISLDDDEDEGEESTRPQPLSSHSNQNRIGKIITLDLTSDLDVPTVSSPILPQSKSTTKSLPRRSAVNNQNLIDNSTPSRRTRSQIRKGEESESSLEKIYFEPCIFFSFMFFSFPFFLFILFFSCP